MPFSEFVDYVADIFTGDSKYGQDPQPRQSVDRAKQAVTDAALGVATIAFTAVNPIAGTVLRTVNAARQTKAGRLALDQATQAVRDAVTGLAPNQSGPSSSSQPGQVVFKPGPNAGVITGNPLNGYISVQYHVSLSAVPESTAKQVQAELVTQNLTCGGFVEEMSQAVRKDGSVTLASTGEVHRNIVSVVQPTEQGVRFVEPTEAQRSKAGLQMEVLEAQLKEAKQAKVDFALQQTSGGGGRLNTEYVKRIRSIEDAMKAVREGVEVRREEFDLPAQSVNVQNKRYYNVKSLSFTNFMSPTPENPMFSNFIGAQMQMVEPHGFRLHEDIRNIANSLGYAGIHAHRMMWRLDIHFSGYNPDTGQWVEFIPISPKASTESSGCKGSIVSFYMVITGMQASTTHQGTQYTVDFAPAGAMALRPEDLIMEACSIEVDKNTTFGDFLSGLSVQLKKAKDTQVKSPGPDKSEDFTLERIYEFIAPIELLDAKYSTNPTQSIERNNTENASEGYKLQFAKGSTVLNAIKRGLWDLQKAQDDFMQSDPDNEEFIRPRIRYTVRVNTIYDEKNEVINDYRKIRFQYIIEPHLSYKDFTITSNNQLIKALSLQSRLNRLKEMVRYGMVQRKYDYLFTSENTEVMNLDLKFSVFYYKTLAQDDTNTQASAIAATGVAAGVHVEQDKTIQNLGTADDAATDPTSPVSQSLENAAFKRRVERTVDATLKRLFGFAPSSHLDPSSPNLNAMWMALTPAQRAIFSQSGNRTDSDSTGKINKKNQFLREHDDNLENDLITIEMDVRGDPIYFYSPYASESLNILEPLDAIRYSNTEVTSNQDANKLSVQPSTDKVIFLKILAPNQTDFMNSDREEASSEDSIIGGFYMVIKVDTKMDGGKFTQKIHAVKIPNMNYLAENIGIFKEKPNTNPVNVDDQGISRYA